MRQIFTAAMLLIIAISGFRLVAAETLVNQNSTPTPSNQNPAPSNQNSTSLNQNPQIKTQYVAPKFQALAEAMSKRQILEEYSQFMSPLRLKKPLTVSMEECGVINSDYDFEKHYIRLCYEFLDLIVNEAAVPQAQLQPPYNDAKKYPNIGLMPGVTRAEAIIGATIQVTLHETGHAVFDLEGIPRLGREEDAADEISGLVMLQFGPSLSRTLIKGTINLWNHMQGRFGFDERSSLGDVHSMDIERAVNYLCLAYGKDQTSFEDLAKQWLPAQRKANCKYEYQQAFLAFKKTVLPLVDSDQLKKVEAMQILRPEDSKL